MREVRRVGGGATVWRGLRLRCGRCGGRGVLDGWFTLRERCPTCGYRFKREEGFFTGVILINFSVTIAVLWLVIMGYVLWLAAMDGDGALIAMLVVCAAIAIGIPVLFYPAAATTWAALDLAMRPLEPEEEAEAATWADGSAEVDEAGLGHDAEET